MFPGILMRVWRLFFLHVVHIFAGVTRKNLPALFLHSNHKLFAILPFFSHVALVAILQVTLPGNSCTAYKPHVGPKCIRSHVNLAALLCKFKCSFYSAVLRWYAEML